MGATRLRVLSKCVSLCCMNGGRAPELSVVIPVYNEAESVAKLHEELLGVLTPLGTTFEIIYVDDGSRDGTFEVLDALRPVTVIRFTRNFGKSQALQAGFDRARGTFVMTMDGDLQDDPHEIPAFLSKAAEGYDLVVGWKRRRLDSSSRRLVSKIANGVTRLCTGVNVHDMNCCFKLYRSDVAKHLSLWGDMHRYIPALAAAAGFSVTEIPINHRQRRFGRSKYGMGRLIAGLFDFVTLIFLRLFTDRPMYFFAAVGSVLSLVGFLALAYLVALKLATGALIGNRPLLALGVLLLIVGFQSLSLGFLGELIIRQNPSTRRTFVVRETAEHHERLS